MQKFVSDIAFTASVKAQQNRNGSREGYRKMAEKSDWRQEVDENLAAFIAARDSFYFATASADGQPYIQHRGGPKGFLKVIDSRTLAFADFSGNRQYISVGNLAENDRAYIFLMDYAHRRRIKLWGSARAVEDDPALLDALTDPGYKARPERALVFTIEAWDVNCPQHIPELVPAAELDAARTRIAELEAEVAALRT
jgi:predicted pyridoxine 5'-phosphate oxidase superfamily flavin-nucleotide-binding protein